MQHDAELKIEVKAFALHARQSLAILPVLSHRLKTSGNTGSRLPEMHHAAELRIEVKASALNARQSLAVQPVLSHRLKTS
ncbi:MAG: hypothetical protein ACMZ7B_01745 [Balneola sp.]